MTSGIGSRAIRSCGLLTMLVAMPAGCARNEKPANTAHEALAKLGQIDEDLSTWASLPVDEKKAVSDRSRETAGRVIETVRSPKDLAILYARCEDQAREWSKQHNSQEELTRPCPYFTAQEHILPRLGDMKTDQSCRAVLSLLEDPRYQWDGGMAWAMSYAVTNHGRAALPGLRQILANRPGDSLVRQLITSCEEDQVLR